MIGLAVAAATASAALPVAAAAPVTPRPDRVTGRMLADLCQSNQALCLGYVVGAVDALVAAQATWNVPVNYCIPPTLTNQQIADITIHMLRVRPQLMEANAAAVVAVALTTTYPCKPQPPVAGH
jgi:hypothetical protein